MSALTESNSVLGDSILKAVASGLWTWIDAHQDDKVFTVKIWIFSKTFYVRDLDSFAELLLGPRP